MITITESAQSKIKEVLEDETTDTRLRMYVTGGGCSGFQYGFSMEEGLNDDDLQGSRFSISNPAAQTTCGCGSSFAPY